MLARNPSSLSSDQIQELLDALQGLGTNVASISVAVKLLRMLGGQGSAHTVALQTE